MSTAVGKIFSEIIRQDKVHIISYRSKSWRRHYELSSAFSLRERVHRDCQHQDEWDLLERGLNRVTDTCIPEHSCLSFTKKHIFKIWKDADDRERYSAWIMYKNALSGVLEYYELKRQLDVCSWENHYCSGWKIHNG
jgi:deoxyhypusine synthase